MVIYPRPVKYTQQNNEIHLFRNLELKHRIEGFAEKCKGFHFSEFKNVFFYTLVLKAKNNVSHYYFYEKLNKSGNIRVKNLFK